MTDVTRREKNELADKPGSVLDSHSSRACVTTGLKQPTRIQRGPRHWIPIWSCSRWGLPSPWTVASHAVRSYRTISPLPRPKALRRYTFCCTFRRLAPPRRYLAPCPVEPGLSSPGKPAATVWRARARQYSCTYGLARETAPEFNHPLMPRPFDKARSSIARSALKPFWRPF